VSVTPEDGERVAIRQWGEISPAIGLNAWAKPGAAPIYVKYYDDGEGEICVMEAEA